MLGAYAFPGAFPWAVISEFDERDACAVARQVTRSVALLGALALGAAVGGAFVLADRLTRPILRIGEAARRVGQGDFATRVDGVRRGDEIGDLAGRMNVMIGELGERNALTEFVSHGTLSAIQAAGLAPLARLGERRRVAVLFSDIRGHTAFTEAVAPEVVVEMLNHYLQAQTSIVEDHGGDVDKFVGDEVVALFQGADMERRATACALAIQHAADRGDLGLGSRTRRSSRAIRSGAPLARSVPAAARARSAAAEPARQLVPISVNES